MTIGMAKVATSAEAQGLGFLMPTDRVTMDRDELLHAPAKARALRCGGIDYRPMRPRRLKVAGRNGYATLFATLWGMEDAGQIGAHDRRVGVPGKVASRGDVAAGTEVTEAKFLELEQEEFLSLCDEDKAMGVFSICS